MSHRLYSYSAGWEWHILQHTTPENMIKICPEAADWILHLQDNANNGILISNPDVNTSIVQGMIQLQLSEDKDDIQSLYFWMTKSKLITVHKENRIPYRLQNIHYNAIYEQCKSAPEAFCVMLNVLLEHLHISLDQFQTQLGELELRVSSNNRKDLLDEIIEKRYHLLHYSHLYLPYREFVDILIEAFHDDLEQTKSYIRLHHRLERLNTLIKHFAVEIDTLLSVDDAISSMRGNEIIRTLTIFTVLCLPATILGSIWGSNFHWLPFKEERFGFIYLILTIFVITAFLSFLLWRKGWTGDIISNPKVKRKHKLNEAIIATLATNTNGNNEEMAINEQLPPRKQRKRKQPILDRNTLDTVHHHINDELPARSKRHK